MLTDVKKRIGKNLVFYRKGKRLSQIEVSEKMGIANSTISKYEKGIREPDLATLERFAELYDCTVVDLVGEDTGVSLEADAKKMLMKINQLPKSKRVMLYRMFDAVIEQIRQDEDAEDE